MIKDRVRTRPTQRVLTSDVDEGQRGQLEMIDDGVERGALQRLVRS